MAENTGVEVAERFLAATEKALERLSTQPESGVRFISGKAEIDGMRRFPVSDSFDTILLFYFPRKDGVDLGRVVNGRRDLNRLVAEGFFG